MELWIKPFLFPIVFINYNNALSVTGMFIPLSSWILTVNILTDNNKGFYLGIT
jgi:hypothetical protein